MAALQVAATDPGRADRPPNGRGMWIWYLSRSAGGDVNALIAQARAAGVDTVLVKSADGPNRWAQFDRRLVDRLHAARLRVCAWQYVYGAQPAAEAAAAVASVRTGADCFIIDAEAEYEGRYASAYVYMRTLRTAVGRRYPIGLSSFPYVNYHPAFPYSVFLGPGGAQFNLPQMYWRDIGEPIDGVFSHTFHYNRVYRRPIIPVGQTHGGPSAAEIARFRALTVAYRSRGITWWDWAWTSASGVWPAIGSLLTPAFGFRGPAQGVPRLGPGSRGDHVLWLQQRLARAFPAQRTTGLFASQTLANLRTFQARARLPVTGRTSPATWRALLRLPIVPVIWTTGAHGARTGGQRVQRAPRSASLPAVAYEITRPDDPVAPG